MALHDILDRPRFLTRSTKNSAVTSEIYGSNHTHSNLLLRKTIFWLLEDDAPPNIFTRDRE